jgi:hypothetical protein
VKKLMLLAAMLAIVLAAAIPALAQNVQPATEVEPGDEDELICLLPEGCDMNTGIGLAPGIGPAYNDIQPVPRDIEPVDCSEALEGSSIDRRAFEPASVPAGTSVIPAEEPGCFAIPVPAPTDGGSVGHVYEYPDA